MKYRKLRDGERLTIPRRYLRLRCCDCGLVHHVRFEIRGGTIYLRAWRHRRATAASRRRKLRITVNQ